MEAQFRAFDCSLSETRKGQMVVGFSQRPALFSASIQGAGLHRLASAPLARLSSCRTRRTTSSSIKTSQLGLQSSGCARDVFSVVLFACASEIAILIRTEI